MSKHFTYSLTSGTNSITIKNMGSTYVKPIFEFSGTSNSLTITHINGTLKYNSAFTRLVIDCEKQCITSNHINVNQYAEGVFPVLSEQDTTMVIKVTGAVSMTVKYTPKFIYNTEWEN